MNFYKDLSRKERKGRVTFFSLPLCPCAMFLGFIFITIPAYSQDEAIGQPSASTRDQTETRQFNTIRFGTETEIAALIQTLRSDGADHLDDEIITLVGNTRNRSILGGAFSFFGDREKSGLEDRAIRAIEEWDEEESETVLSAITYLGRVRAATAAPVLKDLLDANERRFMNAAFRALGRVSGSGSGNSDEVALFLIDYYENLDPPDEFRRDMIDAMGSAGSSIAVPLLADIATNSEARPVLRMAALESLAAIGDPGGLEAVLANVSAADPNIRSTAVTALGPFSGSEVDAAILDAFRDSFFRTRVAAAQASRRRQLAAAVPYLQFRAERDDVPSVREESIRALGAIANSEAVEALDNFFTERRTNQSVRIISAEMLMEIAPERFLESLIVEIDEAKQRNLTALYNGLLRVLGLTKTGNMEAITRRLMQDRGVMERSIALDMAANNNLAGLAEDIRVLTEDRNEALARKARRTMETLGIQ